MDTASRERMQRSLLALKEQILREGAVRIEPNRRDHTAVGMNEDEQPLNEMNQAIASSRNRARAAELDQIDAALQRLADSPEDFGLCRECEEPIEPRRLELMPYVELCIECQRKQDGPRQPSTRRKLTDYR
jgi:DnaK suppressor protein